MDKKKLIQLIITGILVIILIFAINNARKASGKVKALREKTLHSDILTEKTGQDSGGQPANVSSITKNASGETRYQRLSQQADGLALGRDPFSFSAETFVATEKESAPLKLMGIIWDNKNPKAVINGKIVGIGSKIKESVVVKITPDSVVLKSDDTEFEISIKK